MTKEQAKNILKKIYNDSNLIDQFTEEEIKELELIAYDRSLPS